MPDRPPLVCYLTQGYTVRGGHEAHLLHYATELRRHGFSTCILVLDELPSDEHRFLRLLRERGIPIESVRRTGGAAMALRLAVVAPLWGLAQAARGRRPDWRALRNHLADRAAAARLRRRLAALRPDVFHVLGRLADYAWPALPAARTCLHHGTEGRRDATWDAAEFAAFLDVAAHAARNFAPGEGVAANLRREFGITRPITPIFTLCPDLPAAAALAAAAAAGPPLPRRFGIVCRLTPEKGIQTLLETLHAWHRLHPPLAFLFAGSGALEPTVRDALARAAWPHVRLHTTFEAPTEVLAEIDVFVHPSLSDAMPMTIAEALMAGRPCIVTRVGGIPDLVRHEQEGLVIEPGNVDQLLAAIARFAAMPPAEYAAFSRRARARYDAVCRPDQVGRVVADHYRQILTTASSVPTPPAAPSPSTPSPPPPSPRSEGTGLSPLTLSPRPTGRGLSPLTPSPCPTGTGLSPLTPSPRPTGRGPG